MNIVLHVSGEKKSVKVHPLVTIGQIKDHIKGTTKKVPAALFYSRKKLKDDDTVGNCIKENGVVVVIFQKPTLARIATYQIPNSDTKLVISKGSVVDFQYSKPNRAAIVNAANEGCLGGGGVDGAISDAGGPLLQRDRRALPILQGTKFTRCLTGDAKITGPGNYGSLGVNYVIHAVGPAYYEYSTLRQGDELLQSAYCSTLDRAAESNLEAVAFSLLSSGIFRGKRTKQAVIRIGIEEICKRIATTNTDKKDSGPRNSLIGCVETVVDCDDDKSEYVEDDEGAKDYGKDDNGEAGDVPTVACKKFDSLRFVHMCAFLPDEVDILVNIAREMGLKEVKEGDSAGENDDEETVKASNSSAGDGNGDNVVGGAVGKDVARTDANEVAEGDGDNMSVDSDIAKDIAKDVAKDISKDISNHISNDIAKEVTKDVAMSFARDAVGDKGFEDKANSMEYHHNLHSNNSPGMVSNNLQCNNTQQSQPQPQYGAPPPMMSQQPPLMQQQPDGYGQQERQPLLMQDELRKSFEINQDYTPEEEQMVKDERQWCSGA